MNMPALFRGKTEKSRKTFFWEGGEDRHAEVQQLFQALDKFKQRHPIDIMSEYDRIRNVSD